METKIYTKTSKPNKKTSNFFHFKKSKILSITLLLVLLLTIPFVIYVSKQPQEIRQRAEGTGWNQCQVGDNGNINTPCGSCSISIPGAGQVTFGCELDCGGTTAGCPGGTAGDYTISSAQMRCKNKGNNPCTENSPDFIAGSSSDLGGGPWITHGQSTLNSSATFTVPECGRVQVDVQMRETGTAPAGAVFSGNADCAQPTPTSTPIPTPTITTAPNPTPTITLTICPNIGPVQNIRIECPFCGT